MTIRITTFARWLLPALLAGTLAVSIPAAQGAEPGEMGLLSETLGRGHPGWAPFSDVPPFPRSSMWVNPPPSSCCQNPLPGLVHVTHENH
jgi:hypothetical protein